MSPRPYPWGKHVLCLLPCLLMLAWVGLIRGTGAEVAQYYAEQQTLHPTLTRTLTILTYGLNPLFYFLYAAVFCRAWRSRDKALLRFVLVYTMVQIIVSFLLVRTLKIMVGKPRPDAMLAGVAYEPFTFKHGNHSFPSGHTTEVVSSTAPLAVRLSGMCPSLLLGLITALTAYTRIFLGMHHIWDICAGLALGSLAAFIIHLLCRERRA